MSSSVYSYFFSKTWGRRYRCTFCDLDTQAFPLEIIWKVAFPLFGDASYPVSWNWKLGVIFCFLDLMQSSISKPKTLLGNHRFIRSPPVLKFWYNATFSTLWAKNYGYPEDHCLLILPSNRGIYRDFVLLLILQDNVFFFHPPIVKLYYHIHSAICSPIFAWHLCIPGTVLGTLQTMLEEDSCSLLHSRNLQLSGENRHVRMFLHTHTHTLKKSRR